MALENKQRHMIVLSSNINGIQAFLPPATAPITSFFKPVSQEPKPNQTEQTAFSNPLRSFLKRHHWPEILFLQEIKMSPADQKTPASMLSTVNTSLGKDDAPSSVRRSLRLTLFPLTVWMFSGRCIGRRGNIRTIHGAERHGARVVIEWI